MKKLFSVLIIFFVLGFVGCEDGSTTKNKCDDVNCNEWESCVEATGTCVVNAGKCNTNTDCTIVGQTCNTTNHTCEAQTGDCIGLSVEDIEADVEYPNVLVGYAGDLEISIEFYEETLIGSYDLTSSLNNNYEYCEQCVLVYEPLDENWNNFKVYFQTAGTLEIIAGEGTSGEGVLTTITLREVTIEDEVFTSTLVPNGGCYEIQTATWNTIEQ